MKKVKKLVTGLLIASSATAFGLQLHEWSGDDNGSYDVYSKFCSESGTVKLIQEDLKGERKNDFDSIFDYDVKADYAPDALVFKDEKSGVFYVYNDDGELVEYDEAQAEEDGRVLVLKWKTLEQQQEDAAYEAERLANEEKEEEATEA